MGKQLLGWLAGRIIRAAECAAWGQAGAKVTLEEGCWCCYKEYPLSRWDRLGQRLEWLRWAALLALLPGRLVGWADRVDTERRGRLLARLQNREGQPRYVGGQIY